jgi:hypothetical protein
MCGILKSNAVMPSLLARMFTLLKSVWHSTIKSLKNVWHFIVKCYDEMSSLLGVQFFEYLELSFWNNVWHSAPKCLKNVWHFKVTAMKCPPF